MMYGVCLREALGQKIGRLLHVWLTRLCRADPVSADSSDAVCAEAMANSNAARITQTCIDAAVEQIVAVVPAVPAAAIGSTGDGG